MNKTETSDAPLPVRTCAGLGIHDIPVVILSRDITHIVGGEKFYFPCGTALYSRKADLKDFTDDELMGEIKIRATAEIGKELK